MVLSFTLQLLQLERRESGSSCKVPPQLRRLKQGVLGQAKLYLKVKVRREQPRRQKKHDNTRMVSRDKGAQPSCYSSEPLLKN